MHRPDKGLAGVSHTRHKYEREGCVWVDLTLAPLQLRFDQCRDVMSGNGKTLDVRVLDGNVR